MELTRGMGITMSLLIGALAFSLSTRATMDSASMCVVVLASAISSVAALLFTPQREWKSETAFWVLMMQCCVAGLALSTHTWCLCLFWIAAPLPTLLETRKLRGAFFYYQTASSLLFIAAVVTYHSMGPTSWVAEGLFALAAWIRLGAFPFHASVMSLVADAPLSVAVPFLSSQMGLIILSRFGNPTAPMWGWLAAIGALYFALLATVQGDPKRLVGLVSLVSTSLALAGLLHDSLPGTALQWFSAAVATTGMGGVAWLVVARVGRLKGGLAVSMPGLAVFFLLFGLAASAIPGSLAFVSTELLFGSLFFRNPVQGALLLIAFSLVTIAAYLVFVRLFQGTPRLRYRQIEGLDLLPRERVGMFIVLLSLILPCLFAKSITRWAETKKEHHEQTAEPQVLHPRTHT